MPDSQPVSWNDLPFPLHMNDYEDETPRIHFDMKIIQAEEGRLQRISQLDQLRKEKRVGGSNTNNSFL